MACLCRQDGGRMRRKEECVDVRTGDLRFHPMRCDGAAIGRYRLTGVAIAIMSERGKGVVAGVSVWGGAYEGRHPRNPGVARSRVSIAATRGKSRTVASGGYLDAAACLRAPGSGAGSTSSDVEEPSRSISSIELYGTSVYAGQVRPMPLTHRCSPFGRADTCPSRRAIRRIYECRQTCRHSY